MPELLAQVTGSSAPVKVFLPCTGLGRTARGFESFTRACAAALGRFTSIDIRVFGGGGDLRAGERALWNLPRAGRTAQIIAAIARKDPYFIEQATFFVPFAAALWTGKPDVVYFADLNLGNACWHWRRLTGQRYRLLFYNGGATTMPFTRCDLVHQVSPEHLTSALDRRELAHRQFLLPHAVNITPVFSPASRAERARLRVELGIPPEAPLIISVGALGTSLKRLDYVIDEVAAMPSRPHLLLLGAETRETPAIRARAADRLPGRCTIRTLPHEAALRTYTAADVFVLASLSEGFGLVQVEALAAGLPCVAHETATMKYVLGPYGHFGDLRRPGVLSDLAERALATGDHDRAARHAYAYSKFSWDVLAPRYADALVACAEGRQPVSDLP